MFTFTWVLAFICQSIVQTFLCVFVLKKLSFNRKISFYFILFSSGVILYQIGEIAQLNPQIVPWFIRWYSQDILGVFAFTFPYNFIVMIFFISGKHFITRWYKATSITSIFVTGYGVLFEYEQFKDNEGDIIDIFCYLFGLCLVLIICYQIRKEYKTVINHDDCFFIFSYFKETFDHVL